jgi:hypothetical protein
VHIELVQHISGIPVLQMQYHALVLLKMNSTPKAGETTGTKEIAVFLGWY